MPADIGEPKFSRPKPTNGAERLERMLDAKTRMIGVDTKALEQQIAEKNAREEAERLHDGKYVEMARLLDNRLVVLDQEKREIQRELKSECQQHWDTLGRKHHRKEWDLSNPDSLKMEAPARCGDEDARCGLASMQKFQGEDLDTGNRKKLQFAQQRSWFDQQTAEKAERVLVEVEEDKRFMAINLAQAEQSYRVQSVQEDVRRFEHLRTVEVNKRLMEQKADKAKAELMANEEANQADMYNTFNSQLLTEHPATGINAFNPNRRRPDHFKGMLPEEKQRILDHQAAQRDEKVVRKEAEEKENTEYAKYAEGVRRQLCIKAQDVDAFRREQRMAVAETLKRQHDSKVNRDASLKQLYTNVPAPNYYTQWGTSHR